jgi:hypothetical protein
VVTPPTTWETTMELHTLLYTSAATRDMTAKDLQGILNFSREFNSRHNITGLLLYYPRSFMQVLEGEKKIIFEVYDRILLDARHTAVHLAFDEPLITRLFPNWSMGFRLLVDTDTTSIEGFSRFFEEGFKDEDRMVKSSLIKLFLQDFKDKVDAIEHY